MQAYFRMNNEILDLGLSPNELKVPFDNDEGLTSSCRKYGMENIPVAAPSMSKERLKKLG